MYDRETSFTFALRRILFSRAFWIFTLILLLISPVPLLIEYFTRLYFRQFSMNGRGHLDLLRFVLYYVLFISAALAVFIPISRAKAEKSLGEYHSAHKRILCNDLLLFALVALFWAFCCIISYILCAAILIPICAATHIDPYWSHTLPSLLHPFVLSFFNIFSFIALFSLVSMLCHKKRFAIPICVLLFGISKRMYTPLWGLRVFPAGTHFTPAMQKEQKILSFLANWNPGSSSVTSAFRGVYNSEILLRMLHASLLFTLPVLALALLVAHAKDVLARRKGCLD